MRELRIVRRGIFVHWEWACVPFPSTGEIPRARQEIAGVTFTRWGAHRASQRATAWIPRDDAPRMSLTAAEDRALTFVLKAIERDELPSAYAGAHCAIALARMLGRPVWGIAPESQL